MNETFPGGGQRPW